MSSFALISPRQDVVKMDGIAMSSMFAWRTYIKGFSTCGSIRGACAAKMMCQVVATDFASGSVVFG